jgi:hypothetical protein
VLPRPLVPLIASLAIHLMLLPLVYLVLLFEPERDRTKVFMLEGGIAVGEGGAYADEPEEDWALEEDEPEEEADERFDRWGMPKPGARFEAEDDPDWDEDWYENIDLEEESDDPTDVTVIIDEDLEEEPTDDIDLDDYDIELDDEEPDEEIEEEIEERFGSQLESWDTLFSEAESEAEEEDPATVDPILALIDRNPYEDVSDGNEDAPLAPFSGAPLPVTEDPRLPELLDWMPTDSLMAALISLDLLRAREDRELLEETFQSLGYFRQIAGGSELSFFDDIEAVLIASNDPMDVQETFIILRHDLEEDQVRDAIDSQFRSLDVDPNWYEVEGRRVVHATQEDFEKLPWIYFIPRPGHVAVLHESKRDRLTTYMGSSGFGPGAEARLIGELERHMRMGLVAPQLEQPEEPEPPVAVALGSVMFGDAFKRVVDGSAFPSPADVMLTGRFAPTGEVAMHASALFDEEDQVTAFLETWAETTGPLREDDFLKLIGIPRLIDLATFEPDGRRLVLTADVPPEHVVKLLALTRLLTAGPEHKPPAPPD